MRSHPFESVVAPLFGDLLSDIDKERAERGAKGYDLGEFTTLSSVQTFVDRVTETQSESNDSASMVAEYVQLIFACHAFECEGSKIISISRETLNDGLKRVNETIPLKSSPCYIQLPNQMFWSQIPRSPMRSPAPLVMHCPMESAPVWRRR